jgi:hypothetical protein
MSHDDRACDQAARSDDNQGALANRRIAAVLLQELQGLPGELRDKSAQLWLSCAVPRRRWPPCACQPSLSKLPQRSDPRGGLTSHPGRAPADRTTGLATGRGSHADTVHAVHTGSARLANLDDHVVRLLKGRRGNSLGRRGQCEGTSNNNQPEHCFTPIYYVGIVAFTKMRTVDPDQRSTAICPAPLTS